MKKWPEDFLWKFPVRFLLPARLRFWMTDKIITWHIQRQKGKDDGSNSS